MRVIMIGLRVWATTTSGSVCAIHIRENEPTRAINTNGLTIGLMRPPSKGIWMERVYATVVRKSRLAHGAGSSNAAVPGATAFTVIVPVVCDDYSRKIFGVFISEMAREAKPDGSAVVGGQGLAIHAVGEQGLRMKSVGHIDAFKQCAHNRPGLVWIFEWLEDNIPCLRARSDEIQHRCQPYAGPFGDIGPTFFTGMHNGMTFCRQTFQFFERKRHGTRNQAFDRHAPVLETVRKKSQIFFIRGMRAVHRRHFGDITTLEFARQRMSRRQEPLSGIGQRFANADNA